MGLLGRIGKNIAGSFEPQAARTRWDNWSLGDYAAMPIVRNAPMGGIMGGLGGGMTGDPDNVATGAAIGAGLGVGIPYTVALKRIVGAVAKAIKQQAPDAADDMVMGKAQQIAMQAKSNPEARSQIESIIGKIDWDS